MPIFEYEAINSVGKAIHGIIDAESPRVARTKLRDQGVYPTKIRDETAAPGPRTLTGGFFKKITAKEMAQGFRQLATLVEAGIPLVPALSALIGQISNPVLKTVLTQIREKVREGTSFAEALALHPQVFSNLFIGMVRSGELSGTLSLTLSRWADFSEHQVALRQRVRAALTYPVFMFIVGLGVLLFLMTFVVPTVTKIFSDLGRALPVPTLLLITVSQLLSRFWWVIVAALFLLGWGAKRALQKERGAIFWDRLKYRLPLAGSLQRKLALSRWARTLGTLLNGGVPLLQAMENSQGVVGNRPFAQILEKARGEIREGAEMALSLQKTNFFPPVVLEMVSVGEKSGTLAKMLEKVASTLENEAETDLRSLMSLLEPVMILVMGVIVGFIAVAILLPILEMSQIVR